MTKKTLLLALIALCCLPGLSAQTRLYIRQGCAVNTAEMGRNAYVFEPNAEAVAIIAAIMEGNSSSRAWKR